MTLPTDRKHMAAPTALDLAPGDPPLTLAEVAQHYRMPERQLRKLVRDRHVEVLRYGHAVRFDRHALLVARGGAAGQEPDNASTLATAIVGTVAGERIRKGAQTDYSRVSITQNKGKATAGERRG